MYFKINCEKVSEVGNSLKSKSEELDTLYNDVLKLCDQIEENYRSEDSTIYLNRFRGYVYYFLNENQKVYLGGKYLSKTSSSYSEQEEKWAKSIIQDELNKRGNN